MVEHPFHLAIDLFAVDEGHFHVELRKLGLPVGTEVFVAEAAGDLVILVETGDHRKLLQYLRRLRQGEEFARVDARRHDKIACALRRRFQQYRRFDLDKPAPVEVLADLRHGFRTHPDVVLKLGPAQIEISVFQTRRFVRQVLRPGNLKLERRNFGVVQDEEFADLDLDVAGRKLFVMSSLGTAHNLALYGDHELAAQAFGLRMGISSSFLAHDNLRHAIAVPQVDKRKNAKIALLRDPAHQHDLLADVAIPAARRKCVFVPKFLVRPAYTIRSACDKAGGQFVNFLRSQSIPASVHPAALTW